MSIFWYAGTFNSRTSNYTDYIEPEAQTGSDDGLSQFLPNDAHQTSDIFYEYLRNIDSLYRISKDTGRPNGYGKQLLSFCKSTNFFIVNGRIVETKGSVNTLELIRQAKVSSITF